MTRNATDAYAEAHAEAMALIGLLSEVIEGMSEPKAPDIAQAHVDSLNHISAQLRELLGFEKS